MAGSPDFKSVECLLFGDSPYSWQMTQAERLAIISILERLRPECGLEVGTGDGGSAWTMSRYVKHGYSLDNRPEVAKFSEHCKNINFVIGPSEKTLPATLAKLQAENAPLQYVLIDGNHSANFVRHDINNLLQYKPCLPLFIVFHDSFNPGCRHGILSANWEACPFVNYLQIDCVPGILHDSGPCAGEMWGGLALAVMLPTPRKNPLIIQQLQKYLFNSVLPHSNHLAARAEQALAAGDLNAARLLALEAVKRNTREPEAWIVLAEVMVRDGKHAEANNALHKVAKYFPDNVDFLKALAKIEAPPQ
jgi:hypothetical protein